MRQKIDGWEITSNLRPLRMLSYNELTRGEREWMDYFEDRSEDEKDCPMFFRARGSIHTVEDYMVLQEPIGRWIASHPIGLSASFFLSVNDDGDHFFAYGYYNGD